ncbi:MAG: preprotein translocase subunit TatC [Desulfobulbaceae bacterium]|nr:preprotein translocase subunit TatC [Desulfobulbaceae bacterium]MDP2105453.1 twin-arginine translocase subunit TatC [Desulfobulbaceae bacterium]
MNELKQQALTEHLAELRQSLIVSLVAVGIGFAICYSYAKEIGVWYLKPLHDVLPSGATLVFTSYQEAFFFI